MSRFKLQRRTMLRGACATGLIGLGLPLLEAMLDPRGRPWGTAEAAPTGKRLLLFHWPQGLPCGWGASDGGYWYPSEAGSGWTMTPGLMPLAPHRDDFNLVNGLRLGPLERPIGAHGHAAAMFTGFKPDEVSANVPSAGGPSVDRLAAARLGGSSKISGLATGLYEQGEGWWSWSGAGTKYPLDLDPRVLFDKLFAGATESEGEADLEAIARATSILDHVKTDITGLQQRLGSSDRQRLEQHLDAVRELEKQVSTPVGAGCMIPPDPGDVSYGHGDIEAYARLMIDLVVMALRCDITRVALISLGPSQNYTLFSHLDVTVDYHNVCHSNSANSSDIQDTPEGQQLAREYYRRIALFHMEMLAHVFAALTVDDGTGRLLDDTVLVATSEFSSGTLHQANYLPVICAGGGMAGGQNLVHPCAMPESWQEADWCAGLPGPSNRCINDLWQSALTAVGALNEGEVFGDPTIGTTALSDLWA